MAPETEILALFEAFKAAVYAKDVNALLALYDPEILAYDMWGAWSYQGLPAWRTMVEGWFSGLGADRDVVTFAEPRVAVDGTVAFAHAFIGFTAVSAEGKELRGMTNRLTWGLRHGPAGWKILHQHTSAPLDGQTKAIFRR